MTPHDADEIVDEIWERSCMTDNSGTDKVRDKLADAIFAAYERGKAEGKADGKAEAKD